VIASGGAGNCEHILQAVTEGRAEAALLASLLHYGELTIAEIKDYLSANQIPVRSLPS
jgi:cyclase